MENWQEEDFLERRGKRVVEAPTPPTLPELKEKYVAMLQQFTLAKQQIEDKKIVAQLDSVYRKNVELIDALFSRVG